MKKVLLFVVITALGLSHAEAQTMQVVFHSSPNPTNSSWMEYRQNAMVGLEEGRTVVGSGGPAAFVPLSGTDIGTPGMISLTSFPSWQGSSNPSAPFGQERGNRIHAGLKIVNPIVFNLANLRFRLRSSDTSAKTDGELAFSGDFSASEYSPTRIGIWYGPDGIKGTSDDIRRTSGSALAPINELVYIGVANAFTADSQAVLDQIKQYVQQNQPFSITAEYTLGTGSSERQVVQSLPFSGRTELALNAPFTISGSGRVMVGTVTVVAQGESLQGAFLEVQGNYQPFLSRGGVDLTPMGGSTAESARFALPDVDRVTPLVLQLSISATSGSGPYQLELQAHGAGATSGITLVSSPEHRLIVVSSATSNISMGIDLNRAREPGGITVFAPAGSYEILRANAMGGPWISLSTFTKGDEPTRVLIPGGLPRQQFFRTERR